MPRKTRPKKRGETLPEHFHRLRKEREQANRERKAQITANRKQRASELGKSTRKFTDAEVRRIRKMRNHDKMPYVEIAVLTGASVMTIKRIISGKTYGDVK